MANVIFKFGKDISTDTIYPGRYMATVLPAETPQYCFADYSELNKKLNNSEYPKDSIIIADENFGCGSSREQAVSCIKGHNLVIIAKSFARIFMQNAINLGLKLITCPDIEAESGDNIEISENKVRNLSNGKTYEIIPLPEARKTIVDAGGLIPYTRKLLLDRK